VINPYKIFEPIETFDSISPTTAWNVWFPKILYMGESAWYVFESATQLGDYSVFDLNLLNF